MGVAKQNFLLSLTKFSKSLCTCHDILSRMTVLVSNDLVHSNSHALFSLQCFVYLFSSPIPLLSKVVPWYDKLDICGITWRFIVRSWRSWMQLHVCGLPWRHLPMSGPGLFPTAHGGMVHGCACNDELLWSVPVGLNFSSKLHCWPRVSARVTNSSRLSPSCWQYCMRASLCIRKFTDIRSWSSKNFHSLAGFCLSSSLGWRHSSVSVLHYWCLSLFSQQFSYPPWFHCLHTLATTFAWRSWMPLRYWATPSSWLGIWWPWCGGIFWYYHSGSHVVCAWMGSILLLLLLTELLVRYTGIIR